MIRMDHDFVCHLLHAFQDRTYIYLILPFCSGGDFRWYLKQHPRMDEDMARYYAAEIILGMEHVHNNHIVYRDMKPDNILIDEEGHIRISDFGLAVILEEEKGFKTKGGAGTQGYQAPEVMHKKYYGIEVDVWSFGVTLYEFLHAARPFSRKEKFEGKQVPKMRWRSKASPEVRDLVEKILVLDQEARLNWAQIKAHPWFAGVDWDKMERKEIPPPYVPDPEVAHFSADFEREEQFFHDTEKEQKESHSLTQEQHDLFKGFDFNLKWPAPNNPKEHHVVINHHFENKHHHHEEHEEHPESHDHGQTFMTHLDHSRAPGDDGGPSAPYPGKAKKKKPPKAAVDQA